MPAATDDNNAAGEDTTALVSSFRSRPLLHYKDLGLATQNRKIKFTCVHATENFLACGANNGSVYLYATSSNRSEGDATRLFPAKYHLVKMISPPSNDRVAVTCLSICPQQKRLVVGSMRGVVYAIQLSDYNKIGEKVEFSHDFHAGFPITCFLWDKHGHRLFSACNAGLVCQTVLRAGVSALFGSTDTELLLKEETGIVQLDMTKYGRADILLVSSQLRVLLLNLSTSGGSAVQIGTKARQGSYGACFFTNTNPDSIDPAKRREIKVFSSRPGRRVWVADPQTGKVSSTLKFSLGKNPTTFLQSPGCAIEEGIQPRDLTINKLSLFQFLQEPQYVSDEQKGENTLLVSWNVGSSVLFFLDPIAVEIVEWHLDLGVIHDLKVLNDSILVVLHGDVPKVSILQSCTAHQFLELYGSSDIKKSVELALEFSVDDAPVLQVLRDQWLNYVKSSDGDAEMDKLTASLEALLGYAKALEAEHKAHYDAQGESIGDDALPLQVIFKQRPQTKSSSSKPNLFANGGDGSNGVDVPAERTVTLATGNALHKPIEYFDVLAPSVQSFSKSIYTPDGSTIEARLIDINELPRSQPVIRDEYREALMGTIIEEVKRFEQTKNEDSAMNINILPTLKGTLNTVAAAKALTTFLPSASMLTNIMDASIITHPFGRSSVANIFGNSDVDDEIIFDPDPRQILLAIGYTPMGSKDMDHECSVLRIAMSSKGEPDENDIDTEVLLEAISMDIWDNNLKYTSNLPLSEQLNLSSDNEHQDHSDRLLTSDARRVAETNKTHSLPLLTAPETAVPGDSTNTKAKASANLSVDALAIQKQPLNSNQLFARRNSISPDAGKAVQRALQKHIGATPSCDIKQKCMVAGHMAVSLELDHVLSREIADLFSELHSAAATAEKTRQLTRRLWPASGITRVCASLTNLLLLQGDFAQVQDIIRSWLSCFDPSLGSESKDTQDQPAEEVNGIRGHTHTGFARGEALIDGDGLPLTRSDWNLVRTLVSTYFAICTAGSKLHVHASILDDDKAEELDKPYSYEMGIIFQLEQQYTQRGDEDESDEHSCTIAPKVWTASEAELFVAKYGVYLNPDLAAEVCNLRHFVGALKLVLDQVVSSSNMSDTCDEIVNCIAEKDTTKALAILRDMDSLCLLLHLLDLLLKKCPNETIEICVDKYPVLYPWNIEKSLFGAYIEWEDQSEQREFLRPEIVSQTSKYFRYLVRLLEVKSDKIGSDDVIVNRCIRLCFAGSNVVGKLFEQDGRGSMETWIAGIIRQPQTYKFDHDACWDMFIKHRVIDGILELSLLSLQDKDTLERGLRELHDLVTIIVKHRELRAVETLFQRLSMMVCHSEEAFVSVLHQVETCVSKDNEGLSSTVIYALLNAVNLQYGMKLLSRFPLLFASTPLSMYHAIVENHVLTERQMREANHILEVVDTNIWSSFNDASSGAGISFSPQLAATLELEIGVLQSGMDDEGYTAWESKCKQYDEECRIHRDDHHSNISVKINNEASAESGVQTLATRSFEYRNSDWGGEVQLHDSTCPACALPVIIIADDNCNLDVVLLPCGHAFHEPCLIDGSCSMCLESNFESLNWGESI